MAGKVFMKLRLEDAAGGVRGRHAARS
jgi:hypothetical protein